MYYQNTYLLQVFHIMNTLELLITLHQTNGIYNRNKNHIHHNDIRTQNIH